MAGSDAEVPPGWVRSGDRIGRSFRFEGFAAALAFMVEVGLHCEATNHHPEWRNVYNRVDVELTTHDAGAVTDKDLALARHMNAVFERRHATAGASAG